MPTCIWPSMPETLSLGFANNKGTDQSAHSRSLISAFVICFLEYINLNLLQAIFYFIFLASRCSRRDRFESCFVGKPEDGFSRVKTHLLLDTAFYYIPITDTTLELPVF